MGVALKTYWSRTKKNLSRFLLLAAVIVAFFSTIAVILSSDPEPFIVFLLFSTIVPGYFFGIYIFRVFLRQSPRYRRNVLLLLPTLSFISLIMLVSLVSESRHKNPIATCFILITAIVFSLSLGLFLSLLYKKLRRQITAAETAAAQSKSELQLLQAQLSPHFLFNTLNNLYGISLQEPDKTPSMLLKLSELLRYSVYDAKDTFVPLKDELNYLKNYIQFEKIRIGDRLDLQVDIEQFNTDTISIPPMLLVVFVENAFKHAKNNLNDKIQIEISMKLWINQVLFAVKNSYRDPATPDLLNKHSGFGLQSTLKRLELLYPGGHDLKIQKDEHSFSVALRIDIKQPSKK